MVMQTHDGPPTGVIARPTGKGKFETEIAIREVTIIADEPVEVGGGGGPTPYELLSAALGACTSMTISLYAARRGWDLPGFRVEVAHQVVPGADGGPAGDRFDRIIAFDVPLDEERRAKLLEIAGKCPVHRTLSREAEIVTCTAAPSVHPEGELPGTPRARHGARLRGLKIPALALRD